VETAPEMGVNTTEYLKSDFIVTTTLCMPIPDGGDVWPPEVVVKRFQAPTRLLDGLLFVELSLLPHPERKKTGKRKITTDSI
jgi:hypothetical protein